MQNHNTMTIEQRAKLTEAVRLLREIIGEATQLPLIPAANEIADMSGLRSNTVALSRDLYEKHLTEWIDPKDPRVMATMAKHGVMNVSGYFQSMEARSIIEVRRDGQGHGARYQSFRFILKIPQA